MKNGIDNLAAILIKVKPGSEKEVKEWLFRKTAKSKNDRHCIKRFDGKDICKLCPDKELKKTPEKRSGSLKGKFLPCENLEVLVLSYILGPFDFLFVIRLPNNEMIEKFLIECLRAGEISKLISDTQTLGGLIYYNH